MKNTRSCAGAKTGKPIPPPHLFMGLKPRWPSGLCRSQSSDACRNLSDKKGSRLVGLAALEVEIKTCEFHVGRLGDFDVALRAVHDIDIVAETFDETGFVGSVDSVGSGFGESLFQQFGAEHLRRLRQH